METLLLLGIVGSVGYYFKDKNPRENIRNISENDSIGFPETQHISPNLPLNRQPIGSNIYNSNMVESANNDILKLSFKNYKDSTEPSLTGILPPIYNSYSAVGTSNIIGNNEPSLKDLSDINNINRLNDVTIKKPPQSIDVRPMFQPSTLVTNTDKNEYSNFDNTLTEVSLLTGLPIERDHNNVVPFFGGSVKQNIESFINTTKLDTFTGNTSTFFHKQETPKFFNNVPEFGINGGTKTPLLTDQIELDRYIPSVYKQGEKPFYEEHIQAPIAGTEYNPVSKAAGSFKTIDEIRVGGDKQQVSFGGRFKSGSNKVKNRGNIGSMSKNKVNTSFNLGENRWNKTTGAVTNQKSKENYENMIKTTRQGQNIEYYGTGYDTRGLKSKQRIKSSSNDFDNSHEIDFDSIFQNSIRQQLDSDTVRNINSNSNPNVDDYGISSYNLPELERDTTNNNILANANKSQSGQQIYNQDDAKNTIKQTTLYNDNSGNIVSVSKKSSNTSELGTDYSFKTTNKETLVEANKNYKGTPSNSNQGMGYNIAKYNAKTTNGEIVSENKYKGHVSDINKNHIVYSTYDNPIKVRNAIHTENYQGSSNTYTSNPENRQKYINAEILDTKEILVSGEHVRGKNSQSSNIYNGDIGEVTIRENTLLKEKSNNHIQNFNNISNNIPNVKILGENTHFYKGENSQIDQFSSNNNTNNRFDPNLVKEQLKKNPYYNLF